MKSNLKEKILADFRYEQGAPLYGKTFLLNLIMLSLSAICLFFGILNYMYDDYNASAVNFVSAFSSLVIWLYYRYTGNFKISGLITLILIECTLVAFYAVAGHCQYVLYWIAIFPPVAMFLYGRKTGRLLSLAHIALMLLLIILFYKSWSAAGFRIEATYNIFGVNAALIVLIDYFEKCREDCDKELLEANEELKSTNEALKHNETQLRLILDSTAEAIFGIDTDGRCTFCNASCVKLLGYKERDDLLGQNMCNIVHNIGHISENRNKFLEGQSGIEMKEDVFVKKGGTYFNVRYSSYPQYKNGKIIGAVVSFEDITEQKCAEKKIEYLSRHDSLTGLYNRNYFTDLIKEIDENKNLPISVIFCDVNALKLTNDIFNHETGDALLKKAAEILNLVCRNGNILARIGGDEFIIIMPNTTQEEAQNILEKVKQEFSKVRIAAIQCSISMGIGTKTEEHQKIQTVIEIAENEMYKDKTLSRKELDRQVIDTIINILHADNPREKRHSENVMKLCEKIGRKINMTEPELIKLKSAGYYHDIGKVVLDKKILYKKGRLTEDEKREVQQHSAIGYRILNLFDETLDLADGVFGHHERWNGSGYPKGLKGKEIPLIARIIAVAEAYDALLNPANLEPMSKLMAIQKLKEYAGVRLDPEITDIFIQILSQDDSI